MTRPAKRSSRPRQLPAGMQQRGDMYYCRFRAGGHLIRQRLSSDFKVACTLLREMQARATRTDFGLRDNDFSWQKLTEAFLHWKRQTSRHPEEFEQSFRLFAAYRTVTSVREIDLSYVLGFREWRLAQEVTPRTINKQVGHLNHMLNMAVTWRHIGSNPLAALRPLRHDTPSKQRRSLSLVEVQLLFAHSPPHLRPVWELLMTTGLRKRELANLVFDDVDFTRRTLTVRGANAKNHKPREVPLSDDMLATLARLRDEAPARRPRGHGNRRTAAAQQAAFSREHIFVTRANTPWRNNLLRSFYTCCQRAGIVGAEPGGSVDLHALRVSFVTLALEHGATPRAVQEIVGHATLNLTMRIYARVTDRSKQQAVGALPFAQISPPDPAQTERAVRTGCAKSGTTPQPVAPVAVVPLSFGF
ncbi:MAG: tyrosine-type recombinase/integrase [Pirellulaceae bacterium]